MEINRLNYKCTAQENWQGRTDGIDFSQQRWHQRIRCIDLQQEEIPISSSGETAFALIGFSSDEGVRRNGGRPGAVNGPAAFRKACANLPVHFNEETNVYDLGDIYCADGDLEKAQQELAKLVTSALQSGLIPLLIGGGHEIAYGHYCGINAAVNSKKSIGIINFDAHFDLREKGSTGFSSGTGFLQIANDCLQSGKTFNYLPVGIQRNGNTRALFLTAEKLGVAHIPAALFAAKSQDEVLEKIKAFIDSVDHVYLTICMDVFSAAFAPGVSAPAFTGIHPDHFFFSCLDFLIKSNKIISMDVAELNPVYDEADRTAKLTAAIAFQLLSAN
ncbi:formimidoylglutamase [Pedobacter antarcticus]|uniref:formimidoylglutamase n=1 Tax=Pedobacter antarcticus TaxID=34086 RepID=UPI00293183C3|nr:formimidoylglutamase [Pedobacter antarcticus]